MNKELLINEGISGYSGHVKISLFKGDVVYKEINVHNKGTVEFFKYILNCICGKPQYDFRPAYLYLFEHYTDTAGQEVETQLVNFGILYDGEVTISGGNDTENPSASLVYRFTVPSTLIKGKTINRLKLKGLSKDDSGDYPTYAILEDIEPIKIETDTNLEVKWTLILENK